MIDLTGRTVWVTGGSRGIGRAVALAAARAGADVALTYRSRAAEADTTADGVRALGRRAVVCGGDHADPATVERMAAAVAAEFVRIDGFVANAGIWPPDGVPLGELTVARWRETLAANLDGVFLTTRAALGLLDGHGAVVLVSSTAGQRGEAGHADYAASKGALISLTKSLAVECAPGVRVNCVAPGWVDTEMSAGALTGDAGGRIVAGIPLGRVASANDVAGPILFLLSDLARQITGEVLNVNGGSVLCG